MQLFQTDLYPQRNELINYHPYLSLNNKIYLERKENSGIQNINVYEMNLF